VRSTPSRTPPSARIADAAAGLAGGLRLAARGLLCTWRAALGRCGVGVFRAVGRDVAGGLGDLAAGMGKAVLQAPLDAGLMVGGRAVSALQTLAGVEAAARPLTAAEEALLRAVFGDGLDYAPIRLKEGRLGILGLPRRAFTHGDTIFVPEGPLLEPSNQRDALLVHEAVHVWQHQRGGTAYMSEALAAQWFGDGYNFATGLAAGKRWPALNPEQQAEIVEQAFAAGYFAAAAGSRFLVELVDSRRDHGFTVRLLPSGDSAGEIRDAPNIFDATEVVEEAWALLRRPQAAKP
jgi:hypothetical protein